MKYLFILGRNIELSIVEVKSFFRKNNLDFKQLGRVANGLLVETRNKIQKGSIDKLGGIISIGQVLASGKAKDIFDELDKETIYSVEENKLNFVLFNFNGKDLVDILFYLKYKFKKEGLKATEKKLTGNIKLQGGEFVPNVSSKNIDEQYFIFEDNFGRIIEKSNYEKIEERDMKKPIRRNELSISPRLAKILINLSEVKNNETLLDPFCGVGVILEEALLQDIKVIGIDNDKKAMDSARKNLEWFKFKKENYKLINEDSSKARIPLVTGIATEPYLGELKKGVPTPDEAKKMIKRFEELIVNVLKNLKKDVSGKIVFTAPLIKTKKDKISCDFKRISSLTGLKLVEGPINEFRSDSIVGRSVVVLEK